MRFDRLSYELVNFLPNIIYSWAYQATMGFLFAIKQFLMLPVHMVTGTWQFVRDLFFDPRGGRIAMLAFPAVLVGFAAIAVLLFALWGREERVVSQYTLLADQAKTEAREFWDSKILPKLQENAKKNGAAIEPLAEDDPDMVAFKAIRRKEQEYLEKLIQIDPDSKKYRFDYAMAFDGYDSIKFMELLNGLAPLEKPGYAPAHHQIAVRNFRQGIQNVANANKSLQIALIHARHCLTLDPSNIECKTIRAELQYQQKSYGEALTDFKDLLKDDVRHARRVIEIQRILKLTDEEKSTLAESLSRLETKFIEESRKDSAAWGLYTSTYVDLAIASDDFERLERWLKQERNATTDDGRIARLNQYETFIQVRWAQHLNLDANPTEKELKEGMEHLKIALEREPRHPILLSMLTHLGFRKDNWGEQAKALYDPTQDTNAPADVYALLGGQMFVEQNYSSAIDYYEKARRLNPNDPQILNNLAFGYLISNIDTPEKALSLVELALKNAVARGLTQKTDLSPIYHTKGTALLRLNRLEEAAVSFELALEGRPENEKILQQIIECYLATNPKQAEVYQRKLQLLQERQKSTSGGSQSGGS